jgi:hypothetical protein
MKKTSRPNISFKLPHPLVAGKYMIKAIKYDEESDRISAAI